ncbi:MAG: acyl-CoA carboxylase subunit epsilon [Streptosporangiaceae bacterium]
MPEDSAAASNRALLSVVRGEPDAAELAAIVVVLTARPSRPGARAFSPRRPRSNWSAPAAMMRPQLAPGPGAWRASARP